MSGWNFADVWETVAKQVPDAQAQVQGDRRVSWAEFDRRANGIAQTLLSCATAEHDPLWRLPLWRPYEAMLDSKTADINNVSSSSFAGSITCALFMQRFVESAKAWLHFDIYAWTPSAKPGRPEGGECQAARAVYALLSERYG